MIACPTGKIVYPNPQEAWRTVDRTKRKGRRSDRAKSQASAYRCELCGCWHTTTNNRG